MTPTLPTATEALRELQWLENLEAEYAEIGQDLPDHLAHRLLQLARVRTAMEQRAQATDFLNRIAINLGLWNVQHRDIRTNRQRRRDNKARAIATHQTRKANR